MEAIYNLPSARSLSEAKPITLANNLGKKKDSLIPTLFVD